MREIQLSQGYVALVNNEDYEELSQYKWCVLRPKSGPFAVRSAPKGDDGKRRTIYMHRQIMAPPVGMEVDHINQETLDNRRRVNLRICTRAQNNANQPKKRGSSQFKGVSWYKAAGKWQAKIRIEGIQRHLGYFDDECEAARVYQVAAQKHWGPFAWLGI